MRNNAPFRMTRSQAKRLRLLFVTAVLLAGASTADAAAGVANPGFETPSTGTYIYTPSGASWTFNSAGVTANNSAFTSGNENAPEGDQVAFLQGIGTIEQTVTGLTSGVSYNIHFLASQRQNKSGGQPGQTFDVTIDGSVVSSFEPPQSSTGYTAYTVRFTATATTNTLGFIGTNQNGGDNTAFLDNILITADDGPPELVIDLPFRSAGYAGEAFSLAVTAAGASPMNYAWQKDGAELTNTTSGILTLDSLNALDAGDYQVVVSNAAGSVTGRVTEVDIIQPPQLAGFTPPAGENTRYSAQGSSIIGRNLGRFFNRPLYINNENAFVLAGDKPMAKFCANGNIHGKFFVGITRGGSTRWLHDCEEITVGYQPDFVTWRVTDPLFPGLAVQLETVSLSGNTGWAARAKVSGAQSGDKLVWGYGGATTPGGSLNTTLDPYFQGESYLKAESFSPSDCSSDAVQVLTDAMAGSFTVRPSSSSSTYTFGRCTAGSITNADASAWTTPASLAASSASTQPIICGQVSLDSTSEVAWSFFRSYSVPSTLPSYSDPETAFASGLARSAGFASRLMLDTPDARLNAEAAMTVASVDGTWYGDSFYHGAMAWSAPYPGWRTTIGAVMLGWHDRVTSMSDYYTSAQKTTSSNTSLDADPVRRLSLPAGDSIFYGKGRIDRHQHMYDMQTQLFDQVAQGWRWRTSDDPDYEARLRTALELHLYWIKACFDPDDDGTYESVLNCWPTDSVWANGGGCPDETAYAYRALAAARDMAERAGDTAAVSTHEAEMAKIEDVIFSELWVTNGGHFALTREQGGLNRLIDNPWLYSLCVPVEAGLLTPEQAAQNLYYAEYGLENELMSGGGRRVWTSNFSPGIWSCRVLWPGDNYMLASALMQSGFAEDGWEVLRGTFLYAGFDNLVPGDAADFFGGTDFGDSSGPFLRTVVEGLFGYQPDYPNGTVRLAPHFPEAWTNATMKTPDVRLRYHRDGNTTTLEARLQRSASLNVELPVFASGIASVEVDGASVAWQATNGFGCTIITLSAPAAAGENVVIEVTTTDTLLKVQPVTVEDVAGSPVELTLSGVTLDSFSDPEGALDSVVISSNMISGVLSTNLGYHRAFARVTVGGLPQTYVINIHTLDDPDKPSTSFAAAPSGAAWEPVEMSTSLNADITTIYQQEYVSPRPSTMSARVGKDGYSPWTFTFWGKSAPSISTGNVAGMLSGSLLASPQGVPFTWGGDTNVAFTSLWDNWPDQVTVPVNQSAEAAWFMICGSTTILQCKMANAVLILEYTDGTEERLELIPPYNFWNLSPIYNRATATQFGASYYTDPGQSYTVPKPWPSTVELGDNCKAILLNCRLQQDKVLQQVTLQALSQESVIGLMGITLMNPPASGGTLSFETLPENQSVSRGSAAAFSVRVNGDGPLSYQWFREGQDTPVARTQTLEFPSVEAGDYGEYQVVVSNAGGSITSAPVALAEVAVNYTEGADVNASAVWDNNWTDHGPKLAVDGDPATRWAAGPAGLTEAWFELEFPYPTSFNQVWMSEAYDRTRSFSLEIWDGEAWQTLTTGTTIGSDYAVSFPGVTTTRLRLNIHQSTDAPSFWEIQVNYVVETNPALQYETGSGSMQINWENGFLQQADSLFGPWTNVTGAVPPWTWSFPTNRTQGFLRVTR